MNKIEILDNIVQELEFVTEWMQRTTEHLQNGEPGMYSALIVVDHLAKLDAWKSHLAGLDDEPDVNWEFLFKRAWKKAAEIIEQEKNEK